MQEHSFFKNKLINLLLKEIAKIYTPARVKQCLCTVYVPRSKAANDFWILDLRVLLQRNFSVTSDRNCGTQLAWKGGGIGKDTGSINQMLSFQKLIWFDSVYLRYILNAKQNDNKYNHSTVPFPALNLIIHLLSQICRITIFETPNEIHLIPYL